MSSEKAQWDYSEWTQRIAVRLGYTTSNSIISPSLSFSPSLATLFCLMQTTLQPACNVRFLASKRLEWGQERAYKKENECDNVTEAQKKRNFIINSDTDSGKTIRTKGDNSTIYSVTRSINECSSDEERCLLPRHFLVSSWEILQLFSNPYE